jgi:hypothetical protein
MNDYIRIPNQRFDLASPTHSDVDEYMWIAVLCVAKPSQSSLPILAPHSILQYMNGALFPPSPWYLGRETA